MDGWDQLCERCKASRQTVWAPLWNEYLCPQCRWNLTEAELKEPVTVIPWNRGALDAPEVT